MWVSRVILGNPRTTKFKTICVLDYATTIWAVHTLGGIITQVPPHSDHLDFTSYLNLPFQASQSRLQHRGAQVPTIRDQGQTFGYALSLPHDSSCGSS